MHRHWPSALLALGLCLVLIGFVYDTTYAGIPFQDPTPAISARYAYHSRIASRIYSAGGGAMLFGMLAVGAQFIRRQFAARRNDA